MSVLCHFVLDNERIHYRLLHIIQTGRKGALRSLREQIKELDLKLGKVIGMFKYCPKFRYLQAFIQPDSAGNSVRKKLLLGQLAAYYLSCCLCHNSWFYQLKKKIHRAIQENTTPEKVFLGCFFLKISHGCKFIHTKKINFHLGGLNLNIAGKQGTEPYWSQKVHNQM